MQNTNLNDCELITSSQYCKLENPEFIGQTRIQEDNTYYMVWKCNNKLYKTQNTL